MILFCVFDAPCLHTLEPLYAFANNWTIWFLLRKNSEFRCTWNGIQSWNACPKRIWVKQPQRHSRFCSNSYAMPADRMQQVDWCKQFWSGRPHSFWTKICMKTAKHDSTWNLQYKLVDNGEEIEFASYLDCADQSTCIRHTTCRVVSCFVLAQWAIVIFCHSPFLAHLSSLLNSPSLLYPFPSPPLSLLLARACLCQCTCLLLSSSFNSIHSRCSPIRAMLHLLFHLSQWICVLFSQ